MIFYIYIFIVMFKPSPYVIMSSSPNLPLHLSVVAIFIELHNVVDKNLDGDFYIQKKPTPAWLAGAVKIAEMMTIAKPTTIEITPA